MYQRVSRHGLNKYRDMSQNRCDSLISSQMKHTKCGYHSSSHYFCLCIRRGKALSVLAVQAQHGIRNATIVTTNLHTPEPNLHCLQLMSIELKRTDKYKVRGISPSPSTKFHKATKAINRPHNGEPVSDQVH